MSKKLIRTSRFAINVSLVLAIGTFIGSGDLMQWAINRMANN